VSTFAPKHPHLCSIVCLFSFFLSNAPQIARPQPCDTFFTRVSLPVLSQPEVEGLTQGKCIRNHLDDNKNAYLVISGIPAQGKYLKQWDLKLKSFHS